jgi:hypothetical protein
MSTYKFKIVEPITVDDTKFGASLTDLNEPEPGIDPALWNAATAYVVGDRALRTTTHSIYQRRVDGTTPTAPESDPTNWVRVGPSNKWAMWDTANSSQTQKANDFSFYLFQGPSDLSDHLVFDNVDADVIRVTVWNAALRQVLYDRSIMLRTRSISGWWDYFFERWVYAKTAVFDMLPMIAGVVFAVTVTKTGGVAKVGTCVAGRGRELADTSMGVEFGIRDYSTKETDEFGNTTIVERDYKKRMDLPLRVNNAEIDALAEFLTSYRATPALYMGAGPMYRSLVMYGYYEDFSIVIPGPVLSECNLKVRGL